MSGCTSPAWSSRSAGADRFRCSRIDDLRRALIATTLVSSADVRLSPRDAGRVGDVDVQLRMVGGEPRLAAMGIATDQGEIVLR